MRWLPMFFEVYQRLSRFIGDLQADFEFLGSQTYEMFLVMDSNIRIIVENTSLY